MTDTTKMTRLGDILLEKGLLTGSQLQEAVREQQRRREYIDANDKVAFEATSLGEVLIDLGYINRQQLKRGLNWQLYLRNMTLVMSLCAPLMTISAGAAASSSSSSSRSSAASAQSTVHELPITLQAEDYTSMYGIQTENTTDVGGGKNVAYIHAGDWLSYSDSAINVPVTGNYKVTYRVASPSGGGSFALHEADNSIQYDTVQVPTTGGSQKWVDVERTITLTAGVHKLGITALARGSGYNINWFKIEYKGQPLPTTIQAEDYSSMLGVQAENTTDVGGGKNVGYIHTGDWMSYASTWIDIPSTGSYRVTYRVASPGGGGSFSFHEADGSAQYDTVLVPNTGGSQKWVDVVRTVNLSAGTHKFGITALARGAGYNINWFKIETDAGVPIAPPPSPSSSSSIASSMVSVSSSSSSSAAAQTSSAVSSAAPSSVPSSVASSSSSAPASSPASAISSSSSSSPAVVSSASSMSSSSSSASSNIVTVAGSVLFTWNIPTKRENGEPLYSNELGGYELRYRKLPSMEFTYITIEAWKTEHIFAWLEGTYEFEIAAFDVNGLYSHFVPLPPHT